MKIAPSSHFDEVLDAADKRNHVERGVDRAAKESFPADRAAEHRQRHDAAHPWHRLDQATCHPPAGVLAELPGDGHVTASQQGSFPV